MEVEFKSGINVGNGEIFNTYWIHVTRKNDEVHTSIIEGSSFMQAIHFESADAWEKVKHEVDHIIRKALQYNG